MSFALKALQFKGLSMDYDYEDQAEVSQTITLTVQTKQLLLDFIKRLEDLAEQKADINEDEKWVMSQAKAEGFDPKIIRTVLRRRKQDREDLEETEGLIQVYEDTLREMEGKAHEAVDENDSE